MSQNPQDIKKLFLLDDSVTYLNHGSFGACPRSVFEKLIFWQQELENQPVKFLEDEIYKHLDWSRDKLSKYIDCNKEDIVYFPNPSTALNTVIKSLDLNEGDEVLTTNHEYGAMDRTWKFVSRKRGFKYINLAIDLPISNEADFINQFSSAINLNTKVIFISHITSPTGIIFPVKKLSELARKNNIIMIIDGAHAPAQIDLSIKDINPDIYTGACHKWMMAPKGVSFLYVKKSFQDNIDPLVVSWGWEPEYPGESKFLDYHQWQGTRDMSAFLTVPEAIKFMAEYDWINVRNNCHDLVVEYRNVINKEFGIEKICPDNWIGQMASFEFPFNDDKELYAIMKNNNIVVPVMKWNNKIFIRISINGYNTSDDFSKLMEVLTNHFVGI